MIYLASKSPRRKKILRDLGIAFEVLAPHYHEKVMRGVAPGRLVRSHALGKALSAVPMVGSGTILSADTIVYFKNRVIGKPRNMKEAVKTLEALQGQWHQVYSGVAVLKVSGGRIISRRVFAEKTGIRLKAMKQGAIVSYFKRVSPLDKAGAYAIQSKRMSIVQGVKGSFYNAVGLPVESLRRELKD